MMECMICQRAVYPSPHDQPELIEAVVDERAPRATTVTAFVRIDLDRTCPFCRCLVATTQFVIEAEVEVPRGHRSAAHAVAITVNGPTMTTQVRGGVIYDGVEVAARLTCSCGKWEQILILREEVKRDDFEKIT